MAVPRAAASIHVQSIDDKTFRSDTPACTCEERRVVRVWKERTVWVGMRRWRRAVRVGMRRWRRLGW